MLLNSVPSTLQHVKHAAARRFRGMPSGKFWIFTCSEMELDGYFGQIKQQNIPFTIAAFYMILYQLASYIAISFIYWTSFIKDF